MASPAAYEWYERDDRYAYEPSLPAYSELDDAGRWTRGAVRPKYASPGRSRVSRDIYSAASRPTARNSRRATPEPWRPKCSQSITASVLECSLLRLFDDPPAWRSRF